MTPRKPKGTLIIIGGHENKNHDEVILEEVARRVKRDHGSLVVITVATEDPEEMTRTYREVFTDLGIAKLAFLDIRCRDDAHDPKCQELLKGAAAVFFTGGDQLRLTSQVGDTPIYQALRKLYDEGGTIVGTSAGAAAMPETMLIGGPGDSSLRQGELQMAPGLALVPNLVVDSHFAERGRIGRLLAAVAQNPRNLGVGIDEDTAIIVEQGCFRVLGSGAVYVADGSTVTFSSLAERSSEEVIHIHDVCLHVLGDGATYDLNERRPMPLKEEARQM